MLLVLLLVSGSVSMVFIHKRNLRHVMKVCHHNSLLIYGSLRTPTLDRFARVTHVSTLLSLVSCMTLAVSGYLVFTNKTQGNILNNFPEVRH